MSDAGEPAAIAETGAARPEFRQFIEWAATGIGIITSGTAIWSAFTVLGATAENARARIFERQLEACLSISETGTAFWDRLADARAFIDARQVMGASAEINEAVFGPEETRTSEEIRTAQKVFARNVREIQILYPKSVSDAAISLNAHGTAASAMIDVAWARPDAATLAGLPATVDRVRDGVARMSETCAASLASTAQLGRE